ncbi:hypothetical protein [Streptomyces cinereoruber]|uniref:hypothetical protein n=1 Tax=Streptomyces cinereoruber TaxID=67260 RepID=UPI00363FB98A
MTTVCLEIHTVLALATNARPVQRSLVSLAMATPDGRQLYAVNADAPIEAVYTQLPKRIWQTLPVDEDPVGLDHLDPDVLPLADIKNAFESFIQQTDDPQFWSLEGNADHRDLIEAFGYYPFGYTGPFHLSPPGLPLWISSIREHRARTLDSIERRDGKRFPMDAALYLPSVLKPRPGAKNAQRLLTFLQHTDELAQRHGLPSHLPQAAA